MRNLSSPPRKRGSGLGAETLALDSRLRGNDERDAACDDVGGQALFYVANLRPERTGLPFVVFISQKGGARQDIRIKLARSAKVRASGMITVAVRPSPRLIRGKMNRSEFERVSRWIELNRSALVDYWNGDIEYTEDALNALRPVAD